jgi:hypothetical protein
VPTRRSNACTQVRDAGISSAIPARALPEILVREQRSTLMRQSRMGPGSVRRRRRQDGAVPRRGGFGRFKRLTIEGEPSGRGKRSLSLLDTRVFWLELVRLTPFTTREIKDSCVRQKGSAAGRETSA